jgi:hypothetical protein
MKVTRTIGLQGKRIDTLLTHTVAMPEANSFNVATMVPAARLLAKATNCPWAPMIAGCRRVELQQKSVESPHRFGGAEEKSTRCRGERIGSRTISPRRAAEAPRRGRRAS